MSKYYEQTRRDFFELANTLRKLASKLDCESRNYQRQSCNIKSDVLMNIAKTLNNEASSLRVKARWYLAYIRSMDKCFR